MRIFDVVEYEGDNKTFIWKHPGRDFNTHSQLIVRECQEALLFMDGKALDLFDKPGRYTLHTKNIPLLCKLVNIPMGGESPFKCEVYFINKVEQMAINWGIGDVNFLDPIHNNYVFRIGASGEMSLRISDSRKIIMKLMGMETNLEQETIKHYFKTPITTHIKTILPALLREKLVSIFEVETYLSEFSDILKKRISEEMEDYGIVLEKFWINTIQKPENDPFYIQLNRQRGEKVTIDFQGQLDIQKAENMRQVNLIEHTTKIQTRRMDIETSKYENEMLGISEIQRKSFDVLTELAKNEGSGSELRNAAMGLGVGFGAGGAFGNAFSSIVNNTMMPTLTEPVNTVQNDVNFGNFGFKNEIPGMIQLKEETEEKENNSMVVFKEKVDKLSMMKEAGLLSEEEFFAEKTRLLKEI